MTHTEKGTLVVLVQKSMHRKWPVCHTQSTNLSQLVGSCIIPHPRGELQLNFQRDTRMQPLHTHRLSRSLGLSGHSQGPFATQETWVPNSLSWVFPETVIALSGPEHPQYKMKIQTWGAFTILSAVLWLDKLQMPAQGILWRWRTVFHVRYPCEYLKCWV